MKRNIYVAVFAAAIVAVSTVNVFKAQKNVELSDIGKENVEALANNEGSDLQPGPYDIRETFSDVYYNGVLYQQQKIIECFPGGSYACKEGKYYRYKKEYDQWSSWIPV